MEALTKTVRVTARTVSIGIKSNQTLILIVR